MQFLSFQTEKLGLKVQNKLLMKTKQYMTQTIHHYTDGIRSVPLLCGDQGKYFVNLNAAKSLGAQFTISCWV